MLSVSDARARIQAAVPRLPTEIVTLDDSLGRYLARDVVAERALPPYDNSAMDGFAVRAVDAPGPLPVVGAVAAGSALDVHLTPGTALRIMTGAPVPVGADAVVIREDTDDRGDTVLINEPVRAGDNIRRAAGDVAVGESVLAAGARVGPGEIGLLGALGHAIVEVGRRPRVTILSTGDELVGVDVVPRAGQIVNSNAHALAAQVREAGGVPIHAGIAPDQRDTLVAMLRRSLGADVLLTSGGVSVGDYDHVKAAFGDAGVQVDFWKVAMKPGKPLVFGLTGAGTPVFGLPGNPVSAMVVFELFVRPALLGMQGARVVDRPWVEVMLTRAYRKSPGRAHYVRARIERDGERLLATPLAKQGSGMLSSMVGADALLEVEPEAGDVAAGARLRAMLFGAV